MASEITEDGRVIAPLNITIPAPAFDLKGFQWAPVIPVEPARGPQVSRRAAGDQIPLSTSQQPESEEIQIKDQLSSPGGPSKGPHDPLVFPLKKFKGAYAGNGFNMIWAPKPFKGAPVVSDDGVDDNRLLLNLTTEQWTFGPTLGNIPNRGFGLVDTIILTGLAYMQTVQNVTNEATGKGDKPRTDEGSGIHFEPGLWLYVKKATFQEGLRDSVVRMASIPHGTTINAQGLIPKDQNPTKGAPVFPKVDTTPFKIGTTGKTDDERSKFFKAPMNNPDNPFREPTNLKKFIDAKTITPDIIKDPNQVLQNAIGGQNIIDHVTFVVSTGHPKPQLNSGAELNGGGTTNISFLAGKQATITTIAPDQTGGPVAHADFMSSQWWIETVEYEIILPQINPGKTVFGLKPKMKPSPHEPPTPKFNIKAPEKDAVPDGTKIKVLGVQIQYSQTVNLNFGPLTWPHVSVATLVPTDAQFHEIKKEDLKR